MSEVDPNTGPGAEQPSEEEIRAALEEEMRRIHVGDVVLQTVVTLVQLAGRRLGSAPGTEGERDLDQARVAIDSAAALLPSVEAVAPSQVAPVMDALSQLRLAYVKAGGEVPAQAEPDGSQGQGAAAGSDAQAAPQQESRIWVPPGTR